MRQLHLRLGVGRAGAREENVENQPRAVENPARQGRFDVAGLGGRKFVVEDGDVDFVLLAPGGDLLQFARTDIDAGRGLRQPLREASNGADTGRFGEKFQFVEIFRRAPVVGSVGRNGDQYGPFRFGLCGSRVVLLLFTHLFIGATDGD